MGLSRERQARHHTPRSYTPPVRTLTPCDVRVRSGSDFAMPGATMSSARRLDSRTRFAGQTGLHNEPAATSTVSDDLLPDFASETTAHEIVAPGASLAANIHKSDVTASAKRVQNPAIRLEPAIRLPARPHKERRVPGLFGSLPTDLRKWGASATEVIRRPLWMGRVDGLRRLPTTTTLASFAVGTAAGVFVMWFASAQPPSAAVPFTTQAATQQPALPPRDLPPSPPVARRAAEGMRTSSTAGPSSIGSTTTRQVGTSGRRPGAPNRAVTRSRVASVLPATPGNAAGASRGSYRGSLAFRSAPQGARVFVNGAFVGSTPLVLENLPVGSRAVRIEADGYQRWSASTQVVANQQTRVSATLGRAAR